MFDQFMIEIAYMAAEYFGHERSKNNDNWNNEDLRREHYYWEEKLLGLTEPEEYYQYAE